MKINSLHQQLNTNSQAQNRQSNPSFKSIIRTEIVHNGMRTTDKELIQKAYNLLRKILFEKGDKTDSTRQIRRHFFATDREFASSYRNNLGHLIFTHGKVDGDEYTFTGAHAKALKQLGIQLDKFPKKLSRKDEIRKNTLNGIYTHKKEAYVREHSRFPRLRNKDGDELVLTIRTKDVLGNGMQFDGIDFVPQFRNARRAELVQSPKVEPTINSTPTEVLPETSKKLRRNRFSPQLSLLL